MTIHYEILLLNNDATDWRYIIKREGKDIAKFDTFISAEAAHNAATVALGPLMWRRKDKQLRITTFTQRTAAERAKANAAADLDLARLRAKYPYTMRSAAAAEATHKLRISSKPARKPARKPLPTLTLADLA